MSRRNGSKKAASKQQFSQSTDEYQQSFQVVDAERTSQERITQLLQDPDQHIFRFSPMEDTAGSQGESSDQLPEYFRLGGGLQQQQPRHQSLRKQSRKKGQVSGSTMKQRLAVSSSQGTKTIDAPTIISNILGSPITPYSMNMSGHTESHKHDFAKAGGGIVASSQLEMRKIQFERDDSSAAKGVSIKSIGGGGVPLIHPTSGRDEVTPAKTFDITQQQPSDRSLAKAQLIKLLQGGANFEKESTGNGKQDVILAAKQGQKILNSESPARKQGFLTSIENNTSSTRKDVHAKTYDASGVQQQTASSIHGSGQKKVLPFSTQVALYNNNSQGGDGGGSHWARDNMVAGQGGCGAKRQNSAPKIRHGKRLGNHQIFVQTQQKPKKRQNNSVSRATARTKAAYGGHNTATIFVEKRADPGRPPILHQTGSMSTQMRNGSRHRHKTHSQGRSAGCCITSTKSMGSPQIDIINKKNCGPMSDSDMSPIKNLAALALRQNQCFTAMQRHNKQKELSGGNAKTPTSKYIRDISKANKTTSTRHTKRDFVDQFRHDAISSTNGQSITKIGAIGGGANSRRGGGGKSGSKVNSKRNELANYLSKILDQQQKNQLMTHDQVNLHALYNSQHHSTQDVNRNTASGSSKFKGLSKQIICQVTASGAALSKMKKKNKIVMLNEQHNGRQQAHNDYHYLINRGSNQSSNTKRGSAQNLNDANDQRIKKLMQNLQLKSSTQPMLSLASQQYLSSTKRNDKSQSSASTLRQQNSMLLSKHQKQLYMQKSQRKAGKAPSLFEKGKHKTSGVAQQHQYQTQQQQLNNPILNQNFMLATKIQEAIQDRKRALDQLEFVKTNSSSQQKQTFFGKCQSQRNLANSQKDELVLTTEHTILNIKAHDSPSDGRLNDNNSSNKAKSRSTRVEYHSDRDRGSIALSGRAFSNKALNMVNAIEPQQAYQPRLQMVDQSVQTIAPVVAQVHPPSAIHQQLETSQTSNHESRMSVVEPSSKNVTSSKTEIDIAELAVWSREKSAIETYSLFSVEQLEPFTRGIFMQLGEPSVSMDSLKQQLEIFMIRIEQLFSREANSDSVVADLFSRTSQMMLQTYTKMIKHVQETVSRAESIFEGKILDKNLQIDQVKETARKMQKELFVRSEKLHLSEQMLKLKEKEVTSLKNKIFALVEASERSSKDHSKAIARQEKEQEMNFFKAARELKTLYEQNKDLFEHNKALRHDLQDQDEKVRKLVNVIQRHPTVLRVIENELDKTETKIHDQSQISNAFPSVDRNRDLSVQASGFDMQGPGQSSERGQKKPAAGNHGVVFVGQNKIAIPKFDPAIIEKYNQLNIEGMLPHIVETNKFDPEAVKQQVKDMFREKLIQYQEFAAIDDFQTPDQYPKMRNNGTTGQNQNKQQSSGIGNATPVSPPQETTEDHHQNRNYDIQSSIDHQLDDEDVSGGERKRNIMNKVPSVNSPNYFFEQQQTSNAYGGASGLNRLSSNLNTAQQISEMLQQAPQYQVGVGSPVLSGTSPGQVYKLTNGDISTPVKKHRRSDESPALEAGPQKDKPLSFVEKQHQAQTIVTLQNQLYHQLLNQQNPNQVVAAVVTPSNYGTPNNLQMPYTNGAITSGDGTSSNNPNLMSPPPFTLQSPIQFGNTIQNMDSAQQQTQQIFSEVVPEFQSVDQPLMQTPSQTVTLALELSDGLQIAQYSDTQNTGLNHVLLGGSLKPTPNMAGTEKLHLQVGGTTVGNGNSGGSYQDYSEQPLGIHRGLYEEEKGSHLSTNQQVDENTTSQVPSGSMNMPHGGTLQDQISKQYSPILRRQGSLENIRDDISSPSLIDNNHQHQVAPHGYDGVRLISSGSGVEMQEKSGSLLDSIAVKEEESTQKKFFQPHDSSADHGGNEQINSSYQAEMMEQYNNMGYGTDEMLNAGAQLLQLQTMQQCEQAQFSDARYQTAAFQVGSVDHQKNQNYEFEGGDAPLDVSRVENNFADSAEHHSNQLSGQNSADFLRDLNFEQQVQDRGSPDVGFDDVHRRLQSQERLHR